MSAHEQYERMIRAAEKATESEAQQFRFDRVANARAKGIELAVQRAQGKVNPPAEWSDLFTFADRVAEYILTGRHDDLDATAPHHRSGA